MNEILKKIHDYALEDIMGDRFGKYAKEIIQDRAIPDVRDGLKPVQRRILFAMHEDRNTYDKAYKKSAKTVGNVMGWYHPHGDSSIYEAMVRMSQWWKQNTMYIDMHGNNGSMDGDSAAAMRYTEARLSKISNELLKDIQKDTVDFTYNYDDTMLEPTVLPSKYPNLLVNGSTGISAGYATNIPPHNLGEIIDATVKRIESPNCYLDTILEIVKGPDFPTGGTCQGLAGIRDAFTTGKGKVIIRSKYNFAKEKNKEQIIITEIPYEVNKASLVAKIDGIRIDKKIEGISEVRDESDRTGLRIAIDLKTTANKEFVLAYLLKNTEMQIAYNYNVVAIKNRTPRLLGILEILDAYIDHQKEVLTRKTAFDLAAYKKKIHLVEGLMKAISILDEVIAMIRGSKNKSDAKVNLVKTWDFTEEQAEAIVMLQLYKLTNTDIEVLKEEFDKLKLDITRCEEILESEEVLKSIIKNELKALKKEYATPRKTIIEENVEEIKVDLKEMIPTENVVVVVTNEGYVKRVSYKSYSSSDEDTALKPGDYTIGEYLVTTQDTLLLFTNLGNYLYVPVHKLPDVKWKDLGKHISNTVMIAANEKIVSSLILKDKTKNVCMFSKNGLVKKTVLSDFEVTRYSKPMIAFKLKEGDELLNVCVEKEELLLVSKTGGYLKFPASDVPVVGVRASGVKGIGLKEDELVYASSIDEDNEYLNVFTNQNTGKRIKLSDLTISSRAKKGGTLFKKVKTKEYLLISSYLTNLKDINLLVDGTDIKEIKNSELSIMDIVSTGSVIAKHNIDIVVLKKDLVNLKDYTPKESSKVAVEEKISEEVEFLEVSADSQQQLSFDEFTEDFKI